MNHKIFLDIDGVLNQFQLFELSRRIGIELGYNDWPKGFGWDLPGVYNHLRNPWQPELNAVQFWSSVPESSWVKAPKSGLFDLLIETCPEIVGKENVHVVTTLPELGTAEAAQGKIKWIERNLPPWLWDNVSLVTKHKTPLAGPNRLLIDDADHNVDPWREAGGNAILVSRPWNSRGDTWGGDDLSRISCYLTRYRELVSG